MVLVQAQFSAHSHWFFVSGRILLEPVNKKGDAAVNLNCRVVAEFLPGFGDVRASKRDITGL
jgi:hypothetical protein